MRRLLRGLVAAASAIAASASEPFSWADAQNAMHACTNGSRPLVDKYAYLSTRHPLDWFLLTLAPRNRSCYRRRSGTERAEDII